MCILGKLRKNAKTKGFSHASVLLGFKDDVKMAWYMPMMHLWMCQRHFHVVFDVAPSLLNLSITHYIKQLLIPYLLAPVMSILPPSICTYND
jgi:hypothetical protein